MFRSGSMLTSVQRRNPVLCIPSSLIPPSQRNHPSNWVFVFPMSPISPMSRMDPMAPMDPMDPMDRMDSIRDQIIGNVPIASMDRSTIKDPIVLIDPIATESQIDPEDPIVTESQIDPDDPIVPMLPRITRVRIVRIVPVGCFNRSSSSCPTLTVFAGD